MLAMGWVGAATSNCGEPDGARAMGCSSSPANIRAATQPTAFQARHKATATHGLRAVTETEGLRWSTSHMGCDAMRGGRGGGEARGVRGCAATAATAATALQAHNFHALHGAAASRVGDSPERAERAVEPQPPYFLSTSVFTTTQSQSKSEPVCVYACAGGRARHNEWAMRMAVLCRARRGWVPLGFLDAHQSDSGRPTADGPAWQGKTATGGFGRQPASTDADGKGETGETVPACQRGSRGMRRDGGWRASASHPASGLGEVPDGVRLGMFGCLLACLLARSPVCLPARLLSLSWAAHLCVCVRVRACVAASPTGHGHGHGQRQRQRRRQSQRQTPHTDTIHAARLTLLGSLTAGRPRQRLQLPWPALRPAASARSRRVKAGAETSHGETRAP